MQPKNRLDIYKINEIRLGIFREPFDHIGELAGCSVRPSMENPIFWDFTNSESKEHGRLLDVSGMLHGQRITLASDRMAYKVTRQGYTLALLFPGSPRKIKLNTARFRIVKEDKDYAYPDEWPRELISKVIRLRFRNIIVINENYLLSQIGLRN